jgi:ferritin-like metal-binding protein YciE
MISTIESSERLFAYRLGVALNMESAVLATLVKLQDHVGSDELRNHLSSHGVETQQQLTNLGRAFDLLGSQPDEQPCRGIEGISRGTRLTLRTVTDSLYDDALIDGAAEIEHFEIATYEALIVRAGTLGHEDVVVLLEENLEQEQRALRAIQLLARQRAEVVAADRRL